MKNLEFRKVFLINQHGIGRKILKNVRKSFKNYYIKDTVNMPSRHHINFLTHINV